MSPRLARPALASALLALVLSLLPPDAAEAETRCAAPGSRTLASSPDARAFSRGGAHYACNRRTDRRHRFDPGPGGGRPVRAGGPFVAFAQRGAAGSSAVSAVRVLDTRSGRYRHSIVQSGGPAPPAPGGVSERVTDLVQLVHGPVAWIAAIDVATACQDEPRRVCASTTSYEVRRGAGRSGYRVLASGPSIQPRSLTSRGERIEWVRGIPAAPASAR